jgi:hypothetical protein
MKILYLGDSLGVGTSPHFKRAKADVRVGRRSSEAARRARRRFRGQDAVVFDVGTNDASAEELAHSIKRLRRVVGDTPIFMSTVNGPDRKAKNRLLKQAAKNGAIHLFNGMHVPLSPDGIHPTPQGYRRRADILRAALERSRRPQAAPSLDPKLTLGIDKARINGAGIAMLRAALAKAGHDPFDVLERYKQTPFKDGRLRGDVNLNDPEEWET